MYRIIIFTLRVIDRFEDETNEKKKSSLTLCRHFRHHYYTLNLFSPKTPSGRAGTGVANDNSSLLSHDFIFL